MRRLLIVVAISAIAACGGSAPAPPVVNPPSSGETINGSERIGWDQPAADAVDLAAIGYAIYVDGARSEAAGVTCAATATAAGFACTSRLPSLSPGAHSLQIASFVNDGSLLESARSAALQVTVVAAATADGHGDLSPRGGSPIGSPARSTDRGAKAPGSAEEAGKPADHLERVARDVVDPTDLALAPDGRLFVAERAGTIRVVAPGVAAAAGGDNGNRASLQLNERAELVALAIDPQFAVTRFVFAIYADRDGDGVATLTLARFREIGGTFADRAVLIDRIPAAASPSAALRFGADDLLYAAFDAAGDARRSDDLASLNGKVVRLNRDGTTPRDQPSASPVVAAGLFAPAGLAAMAASREMWAVDRRADGSAQLRAVDGSDRIYRLPDGFTPSAAAAASSGDLLIGSADSGTVLRVRFDATGRPAGTERVALTDAAGIRALAIGPDGTVYAATPTAVGRVAW